MPRKKKESIISDELQKVAEDHKEEVSDELESVIHPEDEYQPESDEFEPIEELDLSEETPVESEKEVKQADEEITFLEAYGAPRPLYNGVFVENVENLYAVFARDDDGKKFSVPYVHLLHKDLKAGDESKF